MTRLAVATPGGDSPGMNACLRSIVKHATHRGLTVVGIRNGGLGLLRSSVEHSDYFELFSSSLANTINRSGTILKSSRQTRFDDFVEQYTGEKLVPGDDLSSSKFSAVLGKLARAALEKNEIDALILIGGDSTSRAAKAVSEAYEGRFPIIVVPATIDNDIKGTAETIGFDSAVAMAVSQVDAIRETAASMDRVFVVEVMGAKRGYLAVDVAMATGAEAVLIPEIEYTEEAVRALVSRLAARAENDHESAIVIVAEGAKIPPINGKDTPVEDEDTAVEVEKTPQPGRVLVDYLSSMAPNVETRLSILGHVLRGAPPTARTRNLAAAAGGLAVNEVIKQLAMLSKNPKTDACAPTLIGIHEDGFLRRVDITGDMMRQDQAKIIRVVEEEIAVLGF